MWPIPDAFAIGTFLYINTDVEIDDTHTRFKLTWLKQNGNVYNYTGAYTIYVSIAYI